MKSLGPLLLDGTAVQQEAEQVGFSRKNVNFYGKTLPESRHSSAPIARGHRFGSVRLPDHEWRIPIVGYGFFEGTFEKILLEFLDKFTKKDNFQKKKGLCVSSPKSFFPEFPPKNKKNPIFKDKFFKKIHKHFPHLGHHKLPPLLMKAIVTSRDSSNLLRIMTYQDGDQRTHPSLLPDKSRSNQKRLEGPREDGDSSWEEIFTQVWRKSPYAVIGFVALIFFLSIVAVFHYGRHVGARFGTPRFCSLRF